MTIYYKRMAFERGTRRVPSLMSLAFFHTTAKERELLPPYVRDECVKRNLRDVGSLVFVTYGPAPRCYFDGCDDPASCARTFLLLRLLEEEENRENRENQENWEAGEDPADLNMEEI